MGMGWQTISRRTVLRGLGASVALPWLEAMGPSPLQAAAAPQKKDPLRAAWFFIPNGAHMQDWTPAKEGSDYELTPTLQALAPFKSHMNVLTGLTHDKGRANGDGGGDHARSCAVFLTGCQPKKTFGADIKAGISCDQVAANYLGHATRFPSLEMGVDSAMQSGNCDSGYSCAYSSNISWKTESTPLAKEVNPKLVFERMFEMEGGESLATREKRRKYNKSILDFALEDARRLDNKLGSVDKRKLDEYLTSVREIEARIQRNIAAKKVEPGMEKPAGMPGSYPEHLKVMMDLMILALQSDQTRILTFMYANEGSTKSYPFIDVPEGHHDLSHHQRDENKQKKIAKINRFHIEHLAYFLQKAQSIQENEGTLLDNTMLVYGSAISDGDRHNHEDLPVLMFGGGHGTIKAGRHIRYANETPLNNLWLGMLDRLGVPCENLGDGTAKLDKLDG